jgi:hypothetical protein
MPEFMRFHAQDMMDDEDYEFDYEDSDQVLALNYLSEGECVRKPLKCACARTKRLDGCLTRSLTLAHALAHSRSRAHALIIRTMTYSFAPHVQDQDDGQVDMENEYYTAKGPCFEHVTLVMK